MITNDQSNQSDQLSTTATINEDNQQQQQPPNCEEYQKSIDGQMDSEIEKENLTELNDDKMSVLDDNNGQKRKRVDDDNGKQPTITISSNEMIINKDEYENMINNYENKLKELQLESTRKENILIMRLTLKEQELQDCLLQIDALKNQNLPSNYQLDSYLLDPALNFIFEKMKKEVDTAKLRVEEMQNEMNAWKFSADSITGKQLMAKCRQLHQENEELGKMISSGKIAKLESGLAMHKNYSETLNKSQADIEEVLNEIEENAEGFQNTVYYLQQQLKELKDKNLKLEQTLKKCKCNDENKELTTINSPNNYDNNNNTNNNDRNE